MAKPRSLRNPIARKFVHPEIEQWCGELTFASGVLADLGQSSYDVIDLLAVINFGTITALEKDDAHEVLFERTGKIDDGTLLCVTLSYCPHNRALTITGFTVP